MKRVENDKLDKITGGATTNISGPIINAFVNIIKLLIGAGNDVGSSVRRISEGEICPLK